MSPVKFAFCRTFSSVRCSRNYRLFFSGQFVSIAGSWMQNVAMAWLILMLTHSPLYVGLLIACRYLPYTIFGLFGGVLADRLDNRRAVMGAQAVQMILAGGLAWFAFRGAITPWEILLFAFAGGVAMVVDTPARQALTYQMVGRRGLANAVALNSTLCNIGRVGGPAIAGVLLATSSPAWCFSVNALSFLAVLASLWMMDVAELYPLCRGERPELIKGLKDGIRFALQSPRIVILTLVITVFSTLCFNFEVLLPILTRQTLHAGPTTYGIVSAALGLGALVGALLAAAFARASMRAMMSGVAGFAACQVSLALSHGLASACALLFLTGVFFSIYMASSNTVIQLESPDHIRGRILGIYNWGWLGLAPLGGLLTGWLCATGGTQLAFYVAGASALCLVALAYGYLEAHPVEARAHLEPVLALAD